MNLNSKTDPLKDKAVLVTGGTGSFGQAFIRTALTHHSPKRLIVFSRDEWKQFEMQKKFRDKRLRFFLGDVRDEQRLRRAFKGVDVVVHAAALKQVPMLEYNPFEAVQTNVIGAQNIINAAVDVGVQQVVALSTDKAVNPVNLYGATKLCAEKLFIDGNAYSGESGTSFSVVRYGNVMGSRGSVIPFFLQKRHTGVLPITDERMTRFWITLSDGVRLVLNALTHMHGGEIFIPRIPSMRIIDLAKSLAPDCRLDVVGIRPGEKIHEMLISEDEAARTISFGDFYVIQPNMEWWNGRHLKGGNAVPKDFNYSSDKNEWNLSQDELLAMLKDYAVQTEQEPSPSKKRITSAV